MYYTRRKRNRNITLPEITLTPLIDTALTLLVIFMITTPMMKNSLKIDLPEVKNQGENISTQKKIEISIDSKQNIKVNDEIVKFENLSKLISKKLKQTSEKTIIINGDQSVPYKSVIKILDLINAIEGEKNVALLAKRVA